jgi:hypothetical protein
MRTSAGFASTFIVFLTAWRRVWPGEKNTMDSSKFEDGQFNNYANEMSDPFN